MNLLKCKSERITELLLAHTKERPAHPDTASNMYVDRMRAGSATTATAAWGWGN